MIIDMHVGISGLISNHPEVTSVIDYTDKDDKTKQQGYRNEKEDAKGD